MIYNENAKEIKKISLDNNTESNIYEFRLKRQERLLSSSRWVRNGWIRGMALDWITNNLYLFYGQVITVINMNDTSSTPKNLLDIKEPFSFTNIKVFPNEGYVVVTTSGECNNFLDL